MKNYSGKFNPDLQLTDLDHRLLARYGRDIMLANHIHDRSGLMPVMMQFGAEGQTQVACDEWMSTSPIYNDRNRRFLGIEGDDVGVALKTFQFDIGAPHNYLNFHYELVSPTEGYFWTSTCGPFNYIHEVSNGDEAMQTQLCHHMEDPTFDATVIAVNPQLRCRPVFRPPVKEVPETGPCKWMVVMEDSLALAQDCPYLDFTSKTLAANFEFASLPRVGEGMHDYSGAFRRDMCLENLSHNVLAMQVKEFMLHVFLLNYGCMYAVGERFGAAQVDPIVREQWHHLAPVTVHRLRETFGIAGDDMSAILKVLQLNPFTPWEYFELGFAQLDNNRGLLWLQDCAGYREPLKRGLAGLMVTSPTHPGFQRLAEAVNPRAVVAPVDVDVVAGHGGGNTAVLAWELTIDPAAEPAEPSPYSDLIGRHMWDLDNTTHHYQYHRYD